MKKNAPTKQNALPPFGSLTIHLHVVVDALAAEKGLHELDLFVEKIRRPLREERHRVGLIQRAAAFGLHVSTFEVYI